MLCVRPLPLAAWPGNLFSISRRRRLLQTCTAIRCNRASHTARVAERPSERLVSNARDDETSSKFSKFCITVRAIRSPLLSCAHDWPMLVARAGGADSFKMTRNRFHSSLLIMHFPRTQPAPLRAARVTSFSSSSSSSPLLRP